MPGKADAILPILEEALQRLGVAFARVEGSEEKYDGPVVLDFVARQVLRKDQECRRGHRALRYSRPAQTVRFQLCHAVDGGVVLTPDVREQKDVLLGAFSSRHNRRDVSEIIHGGILIAKLTEPLQDVVRSSRLTLGGGRYLVEEDGV